MFFSEMFFLTIVKTQPFYLVQKRKKNLIIYFTGISFFLIKVNSIQQFQNFIKRPELGFSFFRISLIIAFSCKKKLMKKIVNNSK